MLRRPSDRGKDDVGENDCVGGATRGAGATCRSGRVRVLFRLMVPPGRDVVR